MKRQIRITAGPVTAVAELHQTRTADAIWGILPISSSVHTWGEEVYFNIPLKAGLEAGQEVVTSGDLGYWPPGHAFCIFFGPTPASREGEIRAASEVDVFGSLIGDPKVFSQVRNGETITVEKV